MVNTTNYRNGVFSIFVLVAAMCFAEEKKEEKKKPEPPSVTVVIPLGITTGVTNKLKIRGLNLTNVTELRFTDTNCHAEIAIKSKGKADFPKELEATKVGDTQIELELRLAETIPPGTNTFTLISPDGESKPHPMLDRKSTRLNSSHTVISYAVFCLKKKKKITTCAHESTSYCSKSLIHSYDR